MSPGGGPAFPFSGKLSHSVFTFLFAEDCGNLFLNVASPAGHHLQNMQRRLVGKMRVLPKGPHT